MSPGLSFSMKQMFLKDKFGSLPPKIYQYLGYSANVPAGNWPYLQVPNQTAVMGPFFTPTMAVPYVLHGHHGGVILGFISSDVLFNGASFHPPIQYIKGMTITCFLTIDRLFLTDVSKILPSLPPQHQQ